MTRDYLAMAIIIIISGVLLLVFVKKNQIRKAFFALLVAQVFSWPITLIYVHFGFQLNPVRLFPHATESSFLFAFIFHPCVFSVYYLHYPKQARFVQRILYSAIMVASALFTQLLAHLFTNIVYYPEKLILIGSFIIIFTLFNVSRIYLDWFFRKAFTFLEGQT